MKAITIHEHGGPEVLRFEDVATPQCGPGEVLIRLEAAGINRFDVTARRGVVPYAKVRFPLVLGVEGAGRIVEVGDGVEAFRVGDRVAPVLTISSGVCRHDVCYCAQGHDNICRNFDKLGLTLWGTYAQYVKVTQFNVVPLPDALSFEDCAAALNATATAWELAVSRCRIQAGETVLVNAAGGAVGSAGVQIARLAGARVIASAGSDAKLERARGLGADETVNYETENLAERVLALTNGRGVDAVIETVGGEVLLHSIDALAHNGRLATAGTVGRARTEIDIFRLLRKQVWITGTHFAPKESIRTCLKLLGEGRLRPVLARTYPLAEAADAHRQLESRDFFGNIVLEIPA